MRDNEEEKLKKVTRVEKLTGQKTNKRAITIATGLYQAGQALKISMERERLAPYQLSWTAFSILYDCWVHGALETRRIAELSGITPATVSNVLRTLESKGLSHREHDNRDRRLVFVSITEKGEQVMRELYPSFHEGEKELASCLSEPEQDQLIFLLDKLAKHLQHNKGIEGERDDDRSNGE